MSNKVYAEACKELLDDKTPEQWVSYLFDLQNSLIASGYFEGFSQKGFTEHADNFASLKNFFETLATK